MAEVHSEDLCRLGRYRHYLDELMISLGTIRAEQQLEERLTPIRLLISEEEQAAHEREQAAHEEKQATEAKADRTRNIFLGSLAIFGVLSISNFFTALEGEGTHEPFKNPSYATIELIVLGVFFGVAMLLVVLIILKGRVFWPTRRKK